jgi:predicted nucleic acid-binding protein
MTYLVDSDWLADALKGLPDAIRLVTQLASAGIAISLISYGEIYEGIYYGKNPRAAEAVFLQFLSPRLPSTITCSLLLAILVTLIEYPGCSCANAPDILDTHVWPG